MCLIRLCARKLFRLFPVNIFWIQPDLYLMYILFATGIQHLSFIKKKTHTHKQDGWFVWSLNPESATNQIKIKSILRRCSPLTCLIFSYRNIFHRESHVKPLCTRTRCFCIASSWMNETIFSHLIGFFSSLELPKLSYKLKGIVWDACILIFQPGSNNVSKHLLGEICLLTLVHLQIPSRNP